MGSAVDEGSSGYLHLFNPQSTVLTKNFWSRMSVMDGSSDPTLNEFDSAGYFNTTSALTDIQFKMVSGDLANGKIKMYGLM